MAAESEVPEDRCCDLVMKGGIASGVVYPPAICELADKYRFKNIGGTSAGAIAAVAAAAAEYRRRTQGTSAGFDALKALPERLGQRGAGRKTQLVRLFQPDPCCGRLFAILMASLNAGGTFRRIAWMLLGCLRGYWPAILISLVAATVACLTSRSILATVLTFFIILPGCIALGVYRDITGNVVRNNYGLCKGLTTIPRNGPALTEWLHDLIQTTAGLPLDRPLTFGDLWAAKGVPLSLASAARDERGSARSINLQMFTTNLSHGRPYVLPHIEPTARLFFNSDELREYLPAAVLDWLNRNAIAYSPHSRESDPPLEDARSLALKEIPEAKNFPVLLATRMSLSFPFLFSAVPLWAIDYEDPRGRRTFRRCLFSDGGISSNFPVHLFDGLLPSWPTFGIELEPALPSLPRSLIFLPHEYGQGIADRWVRFDQQRRSASRFGGFLMSIIGTMQNWNDNTLARSPGVRDRVVRLRLKEDEGGMNLNMKPELIEAIAERGKAAAEALVRRFYRAAPGIPPPAKPDLDERIDLVSRRTNSAGSWQGWDFQRWVRLDVLIDTLANKMPGFAGALGSAVPHATSYRELLQFAKEKAPPGHACPLTAEEERALQDLLEAFDSVAATFTRRASDYHGASIPAAEIRVGPDL